MIVSLVQTFSGASTASTTATGTGLGLQPGSLSLTQQTATTTTVKPISTATTGLVGTSLQGLGPQSSSQASSGLKLPNLTATTSTAATGTGLGLGGLKQTSTTTAPAPTLGLGLGQHLATTSTAATAAPTTSKAQTTLKTEFKGLGGIGTAETTKKGAGRDGLVLPSTLI